MTRVPSRMAAAALAVVVMLTGCGESTTPVRGTVLLDGQPLNNGVITFSPADGRGPVDGAPVTNGKYELALHQPGEKVVLVEAVNVVPVVSSEDAGKPAKTPKPAVVIPPNAVGNGQKYSVKGGETALDINVSSKAAVGH